MGRRFRLCRGFDYYYDDGGRGGGIGVSAHSVCPWRKERKEGGKESSLRHGCWKKAFSFERVQSQMERCVWLEWKGKSSMFQILLNWKQPNKTDPHPNHPPRINQSISSHTTQSTQTYLDHFKTKTHLPPTCPLGSGGTQANTRLNPTIIQPMIQKLVA